VLLHRYSGQGTITIGSPATGRSHHWQRQLVGYCVNTLPLRASLADNPRFVDLIGTIQATTAQGLQHQDYPFPLLVERPRAGGDAARPPLVQVMLVYLRAHLWAEAAAFALGTGDRELQLGDLRVRPRLLSRRAAQFDLSLHFADAADGLVASFEYNTDLFSAPTIARMATHFQNLLAALVGDPSLPVAHVAYLSPEEKRQQLVDWNDRAVARGSSACTGPFSRRRHVFPIAWP